MILIADSGSTKTDWCVVEDGQLIQQIFTKGTNPFFQSEEEISNEIATALAAEGQDVTQDPEYPATMKKILKSCIDNLPMQAEKTVDIECQLAKDKNDKVFWNPKDVNALANAVGGK